MNNPVQQLPPGTTGNLEDGFTNIRYARPNIVQVLRHPPKTSKDRLKLMSEAADEVAELRLFISKQAQLIANMVAGLARDA